MRWAYPPLAINPVFPGLRIVIILILLILLLFLVIVIIIIIIILLANADLLKISNFIFFDKAYLQKPHYVMIENISSNKTAAVKIFLKS